MSFKIRLYHDQYHKDLFIGRALALCLAKTIILQFLHIFFGYSSSSITYFVYGCLIIYVYGGILTNYMLNMKKICLWLAVILFFVINYFVSPSFLRGYYANIELYLIYIYYLPLALIIGDAKDINIVTKSIEKFVIPVVAIAFIMVFGFSYALIGQDNYMQFSYALLPFVLYAVYTAIVNERRLYFLVYSIGLFIMLSFGARLPLLLCIVFPIIIFLIIPNSGVNLQKKIMVAFLVVGIIVFYIFFEKEIFLFLSKICGGMESHVLTKISQNIFFQSSGRDSIYQKGSTLIANNGGKALGLFADRYYLNIVYVHNIFMELIINFGIYFGALLSGSLVLAMVYGVLRRKNSVSNKLFVLYVVFAIFARYLVSGSYIIEGLFYIFIACVIKFGVGGRENIGEL